jgi:hypothetical protein
MRVLLVFLWKSRLNALPLYGLEASLTKDAKPLPVSFSLLFRAPMVIDILRSQKWSMNIPIN